MTILQSHLISTKDFDLPKTVGKEEENTPITMPAIGVGLLALVTMLGVGIRRALQPATVLASSGLGDHIMEMKSQGSDSAPTVGWGSQPSQSSRPLTPSYAYVNPTAAQPVEILTESPEGKKQDFLEASPYWDQKTVPVNTFKNKSPYTAKVVSCKRIVGPEATGETCHIIFDHKGEMPYWEGQSYGVIPDGVNPMTGPTGKVMLMPEEKADTDYIMVATGTGIAPYRGFIRRLFTETTPAGEAYKGVAWLFLGVANSDALLYDEEWQAVKAKYPDNFKLDYALSREQTNAKGGKMYIQDKVEEYADEIFDRLSKGAVMYFCGLKGMMPGIQDMLKEVCRKKGLTYDDFVADLKKKGQWRVEVY